MINKNEKNISLMNICMTSEISRTPKRCIIQWNLTYKKDSQLKLLPGMTLLKSIICIENVINSEINVNFFTKINLFSNLKTLIYGQLDKFKIS